MLNIEGCKDSYYNRNDCKKAGSFIIKLSQLVTDVNKIEIIKKIRTCRSILLILCELGLITPIKKPE